MIIPLYKGITYMDKKNLTNDIILDNVNSLDDFLRFTQPTGSHSKAIFDNLYGISHRGTKNPLPESRDSYGLTFFTRPQLCLSTVNCQNDRIFINMLSNNPNSIWSYIRAMLDPRISLPRSANGIGEAHQCALIDHLSAFIPVLSNNVKSVSGWPDIVVDSFTSKPGSRKQVWGIADSSTDIYEQFDLNVTFRNSKEEPIMLLFTIWATYMTRVFEGLMTKYVDYIVNNEIEYNTRIYRLILDESKRFVKKIACTGASFPVNVPNGRFFDFQENVNYNDQNKDIDITFRSFGACYNDPIIVEEFNKVVGIFNPDMEYGPNINMEKIPYEMLEMFNYRGYPYINTNTLELEWYIHIDSPFYRKVMNILG